MFIAHLPAGYLLTRYLQRKRHIHRFLWVGLLASVLPDIDLLYFYLIDHKQTLHHHYWTHLPIFWAVTWIILIFIFTILRRRDLLGIGILFFANIFLHLILDTFVGGMNWLYPFIDHDVFWVTVPATHTFWIWNFVFHWSFLVELAVVIWGLGLFIHDRRQKPTSKFS